MSQEYVRDVVLTAVFCFAGGVVSTLLGVLICARVKLKKKLRDGLKEVEVEAEEEEGGGAGNHGNHLQTRTTWRPTATMMTMMPDSHVGAPWSRADEGGGHLNKCPECRQRGQRWSNGGGAIRTAGAEEERERRRARMEEERRRRSQLARSSASSPPWTSGPVWTDGRRFESLHCETCHRTYGGTEPGPRPGRIQRDPAPYGAGPNRFEDPDPRRESRNVTFDLEGSRAREETAREKKRSGRSDSPRRLRVKLNLSPLRKSRVHPRKRSEHGKEAKSKRTKEGGGEKGRKSKDGKREGEGGRSRKPADPNPNPPDSTGATAAGATAAEPQPQSGTVPSQQAQLLLRQLSSQHLGNRTANLSLLGPAGSHPGHNTLLNPAAGAGVPLPAGLVNPAVLNLATGGAHLASLSLDRQGIGLVAPAASHVVNTVNLLQAAAPVLNPQAGGTEPNPAQTQLLPDTSPLVAPPPGPRPQAGQESHPKPPETQAPRETDPVQAQAPQGRVTSAPDSGPGAVDPETRTDPEPAGSTAGGGAQPGGAPVGASGDAAAPVSGVPGGSSAGGDAELLQQELVWEDGGSAPKRKLRLVLPEKTSSRPPTALERKIR